MSQSQPPVDTASVQEKDKSVIEESASVDSEIDLLSYHEHRAGRLVVDPK